MSDNEKELNYAIGTYFERSGAAGEAAKKYAESPRPVVNCLSCGRRIKPTKTNRAQKYCNDRCKQDAYRARKRANADPSIQSSVMTAQIRLWHRRGFTEAMIQILMPIWHKHGWDMIEAIEKLLDMHQAIVVEQWAEKYTRDMDAAEAGAKRMEELYQARMKQAEEGSRNAT